MTELLRLLPACLGIAMCAGSIFAQPLGPPEEQPGLSALHQPEGVLVRDGERPVLFFQRTVKSKEGRWPRNNYVHPLYDLRGHVITEDFPPDHGHHRGVFWAWHQVWVEDQKIGDGWVCEDFQWDIQCVETAALSDQISLQTTTHWQSSDYVDGKGSPIPIVCERMRITVHPAVNESRVIDFDLSLRALVPGVRIGGSDDVKGYGGFSPRLKLHPSQRFVGAKGELEPVKEAIDAGKWVHLIGEETSVLMIADPGNPSPQGATAPGRWILRRAKSMQNAVYPGREPVPLSMTEPTRLRYRMVIHHNTLDAEQIEIFSQFEDR